MKNILVVLIFLALMSCQNEANFKINGTVSNIPDSTIIDLFVKYDNMGVRLKTDTIINGLFEFVDTLSSQPSKMNLRIRDYEKFSGSCDLWVDYENIEVTGVGKYLSGWTVKSNIEEQHANRVQ